MHLAVYNIGEGKPLWTIRYDRDTILTYNQKVTRVSFIYRTDRFWSSPVVCRLPRASRSDVANALHHANPFPGRSCHVTDRVTSQMEPEWFDQVARYCCYPLRPQLDRDDISLESTAAVLECRIRTDAVKNPVKPVSNVFYARAVRTFNRSGRRRQYVFGLSVHLCGDGQICNAATRVWVSVSNRLQQWTNFCTNFSPKKWGKWGTRLPCRKKWGQSSR